MYALTWCIAALVERLYNMSKQIDVKSTTNTTDGLNDQARGPFNGMLYTFKTL
jgi:hypothetical protein